MIAFAYYLLKVIICSGVLFLYYHFALRNKLFHYWNRFYLLISVVLSLIAPLVQVSIMHQASAPTSKVIRVLQVFESADGYLEAVTIRGRQGISSDQWLTIAYMVVSIILLVSVLLSLRKIILMIRSHTIQWIEKIRFINTNAKGTPFSFFNFIFWNEGINIQTETGQQIFQHELVHVREKHTLDKLFIQLILVVFWCNPFFWLMRRELKLIHEFIADKKAVGEHGTAALAAMILNSSYPSQFNSITNQFFQTSIKRRLAMLTKIQNPRINYLSRILALPILAITVFAFTLRTKHQNASFNLHRPIIVVIDAGHGKANNGIYTGVKIDGISEDEISLDIANKIKQLNNNEKVKILLTRTADENVDLHKRVDIAKENKADLFISLHMNAYMPGQDQNSYSDKSNKKGIEIYVSNKEPLYQKQSELLGSVLQEELSSVHTTNPYLLKRQTGIWVLDQNVCPSVLVECGFLTDKQDKEFITNDNNQIAVAQRILEAIERYALSQQQTESDSDTIPQKESNGFNSNSQKQPLIIFDGKEMSKKEMDKIDPSDIESIDIFKDGPATDRYGRKAVNGVIEIRSKFSKSNKKDTVREVTLKARSTDPSLENHATKNPYVAVKEVTLKNPADIEINDTIPDPNQIFTKAEVEASIDKIEWQAFLKKNLQPFIETAATHGAKPGTYTVNLRFIVKKDGSLSDIKALNDPGYDLAKNALQAMKDSPKWNPAQQNGKPVSSYHTQPITFVIEEH